MLLIDAAAATFDDAVATVTIEDARRADAPAVEVGRIDIACVAHRRGTASRVPFAIECADPVAGVRYSIRASVGSLHSRDRITVVPGGVPVAVQVR